MEVREKGGSTNMELEQKLADVQHENARLKADNEMLLNIIAQMKITLNRLIDRYMTEEHA